VFPGDDAVAVTIHAEAGKRPYEIAGAGSSGSVAVATDVIRCCCGAEADEQNCQADHGGKVKYYSALTKIFPASGQSKKPKPFLT